MGHQTSARTTEVWRLDWSSRDYVAASRDTDTDASIRSFDSLLCVCVACDIVLCCRYDRIHPLPHASELSVREPSCCNSAAGGVRHCSWLFHQPWVALEVLWLASILTIDSLYHSGFIQGYKTAAPAPSWLDFRASMDRTLRHDGLHCLSSVDNRDHLNQSSHCCIG